MCSCLPAPTSPKTPTTHQLGKRMIRSEIVDTHIFRCKPTRAPVPQPLQRLGPGNNRLCLLYRDCTNLQSPKGAAPPVRGCQVSTATKADEDARGSGCDSTCAPLCASSLCLIVSCFSSPHPSSWSLRLARLEKSCGREVHDMHMHMRMHHEQFGGGEGELCYRVCTTRGGGDCSNVPCGRACASSTEREGARGSAPDHSEALHPGPAPRPRATATAASSISRKLRWQV